MGLPFVADNLANVQTEGFQLISSKPVRCKPLVKACPLEVFSMTETRVQILGQAIITTDRPMDFAIKGSGFFVVIDENGQERLSRYGSLKVTLDGLVINRRGEAIGGLDRQLRFLCLWMTSRFPLMAKSLLPLALLRPNVPLPGSLNL